MWFYSNFERGHSLDGEFNSSSNEYPTHDTFGGLLSMKNEKYIKKPSVNINITFFMEQSKYVE